MKNKLRYLLIFFLILTSLMESEAQINMEFFNRSINVNVTMKVSDKDNAEAIPFATAYLIPQGDTTIVELTLSDQEGKIEFSQVPAGSYEVNIELMGYRPYKKMHQLKKWEVDLGEIQLEVDKKALRAATISAAANPIRVVKDTIEFTASAFRIGQNAMLEDLLKKMPGIEIENGKVKLNGQEIDRITVGGKTFFFKDQNAALKNLPAHLVDKIKVIDREKDEAAFTGISSKDDREKVMDIGLKKEFKKGWFGNLAGAAGASINSGKSNPLMEKSRPVYHANAMVSGYNEKDQVVFLANGQNVVPSTSGLMFVARGMNSNIENAYAEMQGLTTSASAGTNWNTQRWKGMEIATSAKYDYSNKNGKKTAFRTSFQQEGPELDTRSRFEGTGHENGFSVNMELKNTDKKKYYIQIQPEVNYKKNFVQQHNWSESSTNEESSNAHYSHTDGSTSLFHNALSMAIGRTNMGKEGRSLIFSGNYRFDKGKGSSLEKTSLSDDPLRYHLDNQSLNFYGKLSYAEKISEKWTLQTILESNYTSSNRTKDAFNPDGTQNDHFSGWSENSSLRESGNIAFQYGKKELRFQAGAKVTALKNIIRSVSLGNETESGKDEWKWNFSPFINFFLNQKDHRLNLFYNSWNNAVSAEQVAPTLDLRDPLQIKTGNVYLKPYLYNGIYGAYAYNNRETFTFIGLDVNLNITLNGISDAIWFDQTGTRYAIPVNVRKPQSNTSVYFNLNQPFGPEKHFSFNTSLGSNYSYSDSYQAKGMLEGLDIDQFDYNQFMSSFWGNADGDRFYNGDSGFVESNTKHIRSWASAGFKYTCDFLDVLLKQNANSNISRYSLNSQANRKTWDFTSSASLNIRPGKEWEIMTDVLYSWYRGYSKGYGDPQLLWNIKLNKSIRSFTLSLTATDLLNQTRNFSHNVSNEYVEDIYTNNFGRYITLGLTWNFGKKGASQNRNVQSAMMRMQ